MGKTPRKLKKDIKKATLIYDMVSIPTELDYDTFHHIWKEAGIVFWDSSKGGQAPQIVNKTNRLKIVDGYEK